MAFLKFGFLFIYALLVSQVIGNIFNEDVQDNELAKKVKKIILDITELLEKIINEIFKATSILSTEGLNLLQKETVAFTLKVLGEVKKIIDKELDRIQPQLNADAKIISKCLESNGHEIIKTIVNYYNLTSICFNPILKPVFVSLQPLLVDLKTIDTSVANLSPQLDKCENDVCVFGVVQEVIKKLNILPDVLKKNLPFIKKTLEAFLTGVVSCAQKEAIPWEKESYVLFNKVATCFRQK